MNKTILFGSVCSGIEAASVAWHPLGWRAAWLAEIEPFPCAVLAHHYPDVPNLGDMTKIAARVRSGEIPAPDVFCGGTPCQSFSLAGLRKSLDDARGNLSLTFCEIANEIDSARSVRGEQPSVIFWENVPGVLSTKDNAFGCFLAGLAGSGDPLVPEPCPPAGKSSSFWKWDKKACQHTPSWPSAGAVLGPQRAVAWRVLDAQYFGVAQRRRRVFVVASARNGLDPAAVLFEWDGLRRDTAPSREAGEETAADAGVGAGGASSSVAFGGNRTSGSIDITPALLAHPGSGWKGDFESETFLVQPQGVEIGPSGGKLTDLNPTLDTRAKDGPIRNQLAGAVLMPAAIGCDNYNGRLTGDVATTLATQSGDGVSSGPSVMVPSFAIQAGALRTNPDSGPDGVGIQADHAYTLEARAEVQCVAAPVAFPANLSGTQCASAENLSPALGAKNPTAVAFTVGNLVRGAGPSPSNEVFPTLTVSKGSGLSDQQPSVAYSTKLHNTQSNQAGKFYAEYTTALDRSSPPPAVVAFSCKDHGADAGELSPTLRAMGHGASHANAGGQVAVAFQDRFRGDDGRGYDRAPPMSVEQTGTLETVKPWNVATAMQVRRLTPRECERLQGFQWLCTPDYPGAWQDDAGRWWSPDYTDIPWTEYQRIQKQAAKAGTSFEAELKKRGKVLRGPKTPDCPDGPRYKALGNSWAVPNVRWIGRRIDAELRRFDVLH